MYVHEVLGVMIFSNMPPTCGKKIVLQIGNRSYIGHVGFQVDFS